MSRRETPWRSGTPCWLELSTSDPAGGRDYYARLFGWDLEVGGAAAHGYAVARLGGDAAAGVYGMPAKGPPGWIPQLAAEDADVTAAAIGDAGGSVHFGPIDVRDQGRTLLARDAVGAVFGVWQAGANVGSGRVNEEGAFIWAELLTRDPEAAETFYADVFGVGFTPIGGDAFRFETMEVDGNTVGGIGQADVDRPYWRLYFGADDVDGHVATALSSGATVVEPAHDSPFGRWAQLRDPQGATYCVITPPQTAW